MLLFAAFAVLAIVLVLFGVCAFLLVKSGKEEDPRDDKPPIRRKTMPTKKAEAPVPEAPEPKAQEALTPCLEDKEDKEEANAEASDEAHETSAQEPQAPSDKSLSDEPTRVASKAETEEIRENIVYEPEIREENPQSGDFDADEFADEKETKLVPVIAVCATVTLVLITAAAVIVGTDIMKSKNPAPNEPQTISATVENVRRESEFQGEITCDEPDVRYFMANGKVAEVKVKEGDRVKKDQVLYVLESDSVEQRIDILKERLENATVTERVEVEERSAVKSTVSGSVTDIRVSVGDEVSAGETVAVINAASDRRVSLEFEGDDAGQIKAGDKAEVSVGSETFEGSVVSVRESSAENQETGTLYTYNAVISFKGAVSSGASASATVNGKSSIRSATVSESGRSNVAIKATESGKVVSVSVKDGAAVKSGETIVVVSSPRTVNQTKTDELEAKDIQIQIEQLENELENYTVKADTDGIVKKLYMKKGENAAINSQAAVIIPDGELYLRVDIDEEKIDEFNIPASATYTFTQTKPDYVSDEDWAKADTSTKHSGIVESAQKDETRNCYAGRINIENQAGLYYGMKADVMLTTYFAFDALLLPQECIKDGKVNVWRDNQVVQISVETGVVTDDGYVEIKSGISNMDKIIIDNTEE